MEARSIATPTPRTRRMPLRLSRLADESLARLVGKGSERAFAVLHQRYHQPLYRYCRSMLRNDVDAQDALQSTLASAFAALRDARRDAPLRPWLFRIAHNEAVTVLRRRRPESELSEALPARIPAAEERAEQRERLERLVADLRELSERQRAALVMRELNGLSHEEIAVALETTVGGAKQTIFEARGSLAEFEDGRLMPCEQICRMISDGDRRVLRARKVRAHLRDCAACSAFATAIPSRAADLRALSPALPPAATGALLARAVSGGASGGGGGSGAGAAATGAVGKTALGLAATKLGAGAAVLATATIGAVVALGPPRPKPHLSHARVAVARVPAGPSRPAGGGELRSAAALPSAPAVAHRVDAAVAGAGVKATGVKVTDVKATGLKATHTSSRARGRRASGVTRGVARGHSEGGAGNHTGHRRAASVPGRTRARSKGRGKSAARSVHGGSGASHAGKGRSRAK